MRILYLTHDLSDPATAKRIRMLQAGGATVSVAGFARLAPPATIAGSPATDFGRTHNARFIKRIGSVVGTAFSLARHRTLFENADAIVARNLEMLAIAKRGRSFNSSVPITYEVLDIHRLLLRDDLIGQALRRLESWLCRDAEQVITSSPAFISEYFDKKSRVKLPFLLLENKVFPLPPGEHEMAPRENGPPWRIGWYGAIRCRKSLDILCRVARENPGLLEVFIRGRVAHEQFKDFDGEVYGTDGVRFFGPYHNPEDLAAIYGEVHFSWAIDMFEEGKNSAWLLPNRLYEGGLYGCVPLSASAVETSRFVSALGIGQVLGEPKADSLAQFLKALTPESYACLAEASARIPSAQWAFSTEECAAIVQQIMRAVTIATSDDIVESLAHLTPVLVVIPCLNEASHIAQVLEQLVAESAALPMRIVVADGGSTDGTVEIIRQWAESYPIITYLDNPKRIQSAAVNLAVDWYAQDAEFLIRLDAHAKFPVDYCRILVSEALRMDADSVTVSVETIGEGGFQDAVAAAQNSLLGNGGSSHRKARRDGKWIDHAHHALMRVAAYRAVGGYDETFTHNEDGELDARLGKAGYRIWLTARTGHGYYPRATATALFRQYRNYGKGRARNLLKHRAKPRARQMLPVAVLPALFLLVLTPFTALAWLPFLGWAGICLNYGVWIAWQAHRPQLGLSGVAAMIMHAAWSLGFWQGLLAHARKPA